MSNSVCTFAPAPQSNLVSILNNRVIATSICVAEQFNKDHKSVLRAIRNLDCPTEWHERNFAPVDFIDAKGEKRPSYEITRDGFTILGMGFTGKEAMQFKLNFLAAFNAMEAELLRISNESRTSYSVNPNDKLTAGQAEQLRITLKSHCDKLPKDKQAAFMIKAWSKLKSHFGVPYRQIPQVEFVEALSLVMRHVSEWVLLDTPTEQVPSFKNRRWLISFDHNGNECVQAIDWDDSILKWSDMPNVIKDTSSIMDTSMLFKIQEACAIRIAHRFNTMQARIERMKV